MSGLRAALAVAMTTIVLAAAAVVATSCGSGADDGLTGDVALAPPIPLPSAFSFEGIPGPWWKVGATRAHFERDLRICRDRSTEARERAESGDVHAAAYRTFLECMIAHAWKRGVPAPAPASVKGSAANTRSETSTRAPG